MLSLSLSAQDPERASGHAPSCVIQSITTFPFMAWQFRNTARPFRSTGMNPAVQCSLPLV